MPPDTAAVYDLDATDPAVATLTWLLTHLVGRYCPQSQRARIRKALPAIAVLIAVGLRAGMASAYGEPLTGEAIARAVGAAGAAVLGHSQVREVQKAMTAQRAAGAPERAPLSPGPPAEATSPDPPDGRSADPEQTDPGVSPEP